MGLGASIDEGGGFLLLDERQRPSALQGIGVPDSVALSCIEDIATNL